MNQLVPGGKVYQAETDIGFPANVLAW
jgi:hypothetical protein